MKAYDWDAVELKRPISTIKDEDQRKVHQEGLDMQWLEMFKLHNNKKTEFISEMRKAFAHIMDKNVTDTMRTKIQTQSDYNTRIKNDPIALLEAIRTLTHDPIRAQYPFLSLFDSLFRLITIRQQCRTLRACRSI